MQLQFGLYATAQSNLKCKTFEFKGVLARVNGALTPF
jgi:hypothetical protein